MSRAAAWMLCTMTAVESKSVPSQSNTTRSKRRGRERSAGVGVGSMAVRRVGDSGGGRGVSGGGRLRGQSFEQARALAGQRGLELQALAGGGMVERQPARMEEHPLEAYPRD